MEKPCGARWGMVAKHRIPSRIQAQGGARSVRRDGLEIASSELLNTRYKAIQSKYTRHTRHRRQSHRCLDEPEYRGKALWSTVGHGCETPDPQQDSSRRRCQKRAQRCSRNSIFGTAKYKAIQSKNLQGIQGIEGKAIDVWMNRSTVEKCCGARWGMVAKHRIPSRIQAQGGARSVRRDALEIASSEPLNTRHTRHTMQNKAYKA